MINVINEYLRERGITKKDFAERIKLNRMSVSNALLHNQNTHRVIENLKDNDPILYKKLLNKKLNKMREEKPYTPISKDEELKIRYTKTNRVGVYY